VGFLFDLQMRAQPAMRILLICDTCRQSVTDSAGDQTSAGVQVRLFGAVNYGICPSCYQEVVSNKDRAYRQRAGKVIRWKRCRAFREAREAAEKGDK
jgi:hypothetical protein